jgi:hypothetical protein
VKAAGINESSQQLVPQIVDDDFPSPAGPFFTTHLLLYKVG